MEHRSRILAVALALLFISSLAWAAAPTAPAPAKADPAGVQTVQAPAEAPAENPADPAELDLGIPEPVPTCPTCNEICNAEYDDCMAGCGGSPFQCEVQCGEEWNTCMATCQP
jgi:hypothetical protein